MKPLFVVTLLLGLGPHAAWGLDPKPELQQRLGEVRLSIAQNQARLKSYQWVETTELSLKGEVKQREESKGRCGSDDKIQRSPIGAPTEPRKAARGLKGKIVEKKTDEFKDYMERFGSLPSRYIPPDAALMQQAYPADKASLERASGEALTAIVLRDHAKPGDEVGFTFDTAPKKLRGFSVATYLDGAEDAVGVEARLPSLGDGTNYVEEAVLTSKSKQLEIRKTNFG